MLARTCRSIAYRLRLALTASVLLLASRVAVAQDISVTRLPVDTDMTVRLANLTTHVNYDRAGNSFFIVPAGRYSVQLLRAGQVAYQEVEYIDADAPSSRTVNPNRMEIVMGLPNGNPQFDSSVCGALEAAAQLAIRTYGLRNTDLQQRLATAEIDSSNKCASQSSIDDVGQTVAGSYGVTPLGLVALAIEYTPLAGQHRPRNQGNSPIYRDPSTQRLATSQQPRTNLTPSLITDLENGMSDVAFDADGKSLIVCAALDASTPVFCDSNGFAVATPAIAHLRGFYRFSVKATPVDHWGAEVDHWTAFASHDDAYGMQDRIATAASNMKSKLEARIDQMQGYVAPAPDGTGQNAGEHGYPTPDIVALIKTTQTDFDQALDDPMLQPLRQHFPATLARVASPTAEVTSNLEAQRIFSELRSDVAILDSVSDDFAIDLVFRSSPVETEGAHLNFVSCKRCSPIISQGGQHRFYRGKYYIQATLDGYVAYEGWLDLVEDPRHILECDLVRVRRASHGGASTCSLRAQ